MATLDTIDLTTNAVWSNEFEGSGIENTQKWTTSGRLFVFQKAKTKFKKMVFSGFWLNYSVVQQLETLRDTGAAVVLTHNDDRTFSVILETVDAVPVQDFAEYTATDKFEITLTMIQL